jgi:hypothetical protein
MAKSRTKGSVRQDNRNDENRALRSDVMLALFGFRCNHEYHLPAHPPLLRSAIPPCSALLRIHTPCPSSKPNKTVKY